MDAFVPEVMWRLKLSFLMSAESECCQDTVRLNSFSITSFAPVLNNTSEFPSICIRYSGEESFCGHSACKSNIWSG